MASRFQQRDSRSALFGNYEARTASGSPAGGSRPGSGYGYQANGHSGSTASNNGAFSAYPGASGQSGYRTATPNSKGHYSDAVLSELESQNDEQLSGMSAKVKMLKDVSPPQHRGRKEQD